MRGTVSLAKKRKITFPTMSSSSSEPALQIFNPSFLRPTTKKRVGGGGGGGNNGGNADVKRARKRKQQQQQQQQYSDLPFASVPPAPIVNDDYVRPKYRRTLIQRAKTPAEVAELSKGSAPIVSPFESETADLEQLRRLQSSQESEAKMLAAASASAMTPVAAAPPLQPRKKKITTVQRRTVGFDRVTRQLKMVLPGAEDKEKHDRELLEYLNTDVIEMKKELIKNHLLKHGSAARDETVRTIYMAMKQVGCIKNDNLATKWHNYTAAASASDSTTTQQDASSSSSLRIQVL